MRHEPQTARASKALHSLIYAVRRLFWPSRIFAILGALPGTLLGVEIGMTRAYALKTIVLVAACGALVGALSAWWGFVGVGAVHYLRWKSRRENVRD